MTDQNAQRYAQTIVLADFDVLEEYLMGMNEEGIHPDLPFIDAHGNASIAHGMAPSGDDWAVGYEAPRDPDSGVPHCCYCLEHRPVDCDAGATWEPTFPVTALVRVEGAQTTPVSTPSGPSAGLEGQGATQETQDATEAAQRPLLSHLIDRPLDAAAFGVGEPLAQRHAHRHKVYLDGKYDYCIAGCQWCSQPLTRDRTAVDAIIRLLSALGDRPFVIEITDDAPKDTTAPSEGR